MQDAADHVSSLTQPAIACEPWQRASPPFAALTLPRTASLLSSIAASLGADASEKRAVAKAMASAIAACVQRASGSGSDQVGQWQALMGPVSELLLLGATTTREVQGRVMLLMLVVMQFLAAGARCC